MATKKKSSSPSPSKASVKKSVAAKPSVGAPDDQATDRVTLRTLSKRCGLSQHAARVRLNKAGVKRPGTRWAFKSGSTQLAKAIKVLQETYFG